MDYRGERNVREIGKALRVSHVLEGSVRKTSAVFHLDAQLIDTRTNARVWAEQYDVDLNQRFTIQSEIAQKIAQQLHAKISAAEALSIAQPITTDLTAFDLYTRARNLLLMKRLSASTRANFFQAIDLLDAAVARDPTFFQAYCQLASAHGNLYFLASTIRRRGGRWRKRRFNQRFACMAMLVRPTSQAQKISIWDTSTTTELWLNS